MQTATYDVVVAKTFPRIGAYLLDGIIIFLLFVAFYNYIMYPIAKQLWSVDVLEQQYVSHMKDFGIIVELPDTTTEDPNDTYDYNLYGISNSDQYAELFPDATMTYDEFLVDLNNKAALFYADEEASGVETLLSVYNLVQIAISFLISQLLVFYILPLILKNGQTPGKKMMHLGLATPEGLIIRNWQLFARFLIGIYAVETILSIATYMMFGLPLLPLLISAIMVLLTRRHVALHDLIAGTVVVDLRQTLLTNTLEERQQAEPNHTFFESRTPLLHNEPSSNEDKQDV
jgi:uncharacterized RDD family membrane protein YckC